MKIKKPSPSTNYLIYDGECRFCCRWINHWQTIFNLSSIQITPFQELNQISFSYDIDEKDFENELYFIYNEQIYRGAEAVFKLYHLNNKKLLYVLYKCFPGFSIISKISYMTIAKNRKFFSKFIIPK